MSRLVAVTVFAGLLLAGAFADDAYPPPWRGDVDPPYRSLAMWEFDDDSNLALPDYYENTHGVPVAEITPGPGMGWLYEYDGRFGVWELSGEIVAKIPNEEYPLTKEVWIQITWALQPDGVDPLHVEGIPFYGGQQGDPVPGELEHEFPIGPGESWWHSTYTLDFPQPEKEWIRIWGDVNVDELVIDTQCIPEPGTLSLLGLAAALALVRRR